MKGMFLLQCIGWFTKYTISMVNLVWWLATKTTRWASAIKGRSLRLTGRSIGRQKPPRDGLLRPLYWDTRALLSRPGVSRSMIPVGEQLKEFIDEWVHITQDPFMLGTVQGHLLQFSYKHPLEKLLTSAR